MNAQAVIIGAGPAGLTAAYELLKRTNIQPVVLETENFVGGISRTVNYKGNRMDIGGHRFFSKSDRVMKWWAEHMPAEPPPPDPRLDRMLDPSEDGDMHRMLVRQRVSRIYYLRKFFNYPIKLNISTVVNLGVSRIARIGVSYGRASLFPRRSERSLEDFLVNRFGQELYETFFRDYTEKVWGVPCNQIKPEWGAQRIKGLSVWEAIRHALSSVLRRSQSLEQKDLQTSLIERFLYPKYGPGQLWESVADKVVSRGGKLFQNHLVVGLEVESGRVVKVRARDERWEIREFASDYVFSTMPISELISAMGSVPPQEVRRVASGLCYRDFVTIGLLVDRLEIRNQTSIPTRNGIVPDNWIYIQEPEVKIGRLQLFQNWSPYMIAEPQHVWLGLEYFCREGDELWSMDDAETIEFGGTELARIGIIPRDGILDGTVVRVPKTYPAYFGTYDELNVVRNFTDAISNLYLVGRNGMHRYNNADHSMLTAMTAVDNIVAGNLGKANIWSVNTEQEYHEGEA